MKRFTIISLFALVFSACAITHKGRAIQLAVASDGVADEVALQWDKQGHARIDKCRAEGHETKEARGRCMGLYAILKDDVEAMLEALVAAQMAVRLAAECDSNPLKVPVEFLDRCVEGEQADWKALAKQITVAWDAIRPLFQEIRKDKK